MGECYANGFVSTPRRLLGLAEVRLSHDHLSSVSPPPICPSAPPPTHCPSRSPFPQLCQLRRRTSATAITPFEGTTEEECAGDRGRGASVGGAGPSDHRAPPLRAGRRRSKRPTEPKHETFFIVVHPTTDGGTAPTASRCVPAFPLLVGPATN